MRYFKAGIGWAAVWILLGAFNLWRAVVWNTTAWRRR